MLRVVLKWGDCYCLDRGGGDRYYDSEMLFLLIDTLHSFPPPRVLCLFSAATDTGLTCCRLSLRFHHRYRLNHGNAAVGPDLTPFRCLTTATPPLSYDKSSGHQDLDCIGMMLRAYVHRNAVYPDLPDLVEGNALDFNALGL